MDNISIRPLSPIGPIGPIGRMEMLNLLVLVRGQGGLDLHGDGRVAFLAGRHYNDGALFEVFLTHTISRTQPTAPRSTSSGARIGPARLWISGTIRTVRALTSGCSLFNVLAIAASSACAC